MTWKLSLKKGYAGLLYRAGIVTALKGFHGRKNIVRATTGSSPGAQTS